MTKLYKYLNSNLTHFGFKYKNGLNVDTVPFDPSDSCKPGGLYYSSEDILHYVSKLNGYIAEIEIPEDAQVYKDPVVRPEKWKADKIIIKRKYKITLKLLERMIKDGVKFDLGVKNLLLQKVAYQNSLDIVKFLVESGASELNPALNTASSFGHLDVVKFLVESGVSELNFALQNASYYGHLNIVKFLVESGADDFSSVLQCASRYGHLDIVKFLVESGANDFNSALNTASSFGHLDVVKFLVESGADDLNYALNSASNYGHSDIVKFLEEKIEERKK